MKIGHLTHTRLELGDDDDERKEGNERRRQGNNQSIDVVAAHIEEGDRVELRSQSSL